MSLLADWMKSRLSGDPRSVREVAEEIGVSHTTVAKWLRGSRPSWEHCDLIATFFDVPVSSVRQMAGYGEARSGGSGGASRLSPEEDALQFAHDRFDVHRSVLPTLREMGLTMDDLVRAVCDNASHLVPFDGPPNRDGDEPGVVRCGHLLVRLWYHRDQPRYIYVEEVSR